MRAIVHALLGKETNTDDHESKSPTTKCRQIKRRSRSPEKSLSPAKRIRSTSSTATTNSNSSISSSSNSSISTNTTPGLSQEKEHRSITPSKHSPKRNSSANHPHSSPKPPSEGSFMPDYHEDMEQDKTEPQTSAKISAPSSTSTATNAMTENDIRLITTATQGVIHQMIITHLTRMNNQIEHLINTLSRRHDDPKPQDPQIGLKHLMGDVRAELKVMNQVMSQHTSATHSMNKTLKEFTTAIKSQTAQMEILWNANISSQNTCSQALIALTEKISGHQKTPLTSRNARRRSM